MKKVFLTIAVLFLYTSSSIGNVSFGKKSGKVEFKAKGWPSLLKINGKGEGFSGVLVEKDSKFSGELKFELKTLKTGIDLRDEHLKNKYLKIQKNPLAILRIEGLKIKKNGKSKIKFNGDLTLNGVTKKVFVEAKVSNNKNKMKVDAEFKLKLSNFEIEIPSFKGITVAEEVEVKASSKGEVSE